MGKKNWVKRSELPSVFFLLWPSEIQSHLLPLYHLSTPGLPLSGFPLLFLFLYLFFLVSVDTTLPGMKIFIFLRARFYLLISHPVDHLLASYSSLLMNIILFSFKNHRVRLFTHNSFFSPWNCSPVTLKTPTSHALHRLLVSAHAVLSV
jgi:hypothetical protein